MPRDRSGGQPGRLVGARARCAPLVARRRGHRPGRSRHRGAHTSAHRPRRVGGRDRDGRPVSGRRGGRQRFDRRPPALSKVAFSRRAVRSHSFSVVSSLPVARNFPSRLTARLSMFRSWPLSSPTGLVTSRSGLLLAFGLPFGSAGGASFGHSTKAVGTATAAAAAPSPPNSTERRRIGRPPTGVVAGSGGMAGVMAGTGGAAGAVTANRCRTSEVGGRPRVLGEAMADQGVQRAAHGCFACDPVDDRQDGRRVERAPTGGGEGQHRAQ